MSENDKGFFFFIEHSNERSIGAHRVFEALDDVL